MSLCVCCGAPAAEGALCEEHVAALGQCRDITAEQIRVTGAGDAPGRASALPASALPAIGLIDQWGRVHPVSVPVMLGRSLERCSLAILHHSVSAQHARIERSNGALRVVDCGSLNGTFVGGERVRRAALADGDVIALGQVCLALSLRGRSSSGRAAAVGGTVPLAASGIALAVRLSRGDQACEVRQRVTGGVVRIGGDAVDLAALEFALIEALVERALAERDAELQFVSTDELLGRLVFRSQYANDENLRELVGRVRRKLAKVGIRGAIESRRGAGYRMAWTVVPDAATRPTRAGPGGKAGPRGNRGSRGDRGDRGNRNS